MKPWILTWTILALAILGQNAQAEVRTFTSSNGESLEVEVLNVDADGVEFRRISDQRIFKLPVNRLSLDDQAWVQQKLKAREDATHPLDWKPVSIFTELPMDQINAITLANSLTRVGAKEWTGDLPIGSWVEIHVLRQRRINPLQERFFVQYDGEPEWHISFDNGLLLIAHDPAAAPQVYGIGLREGGKTARQVEKELKDRKDFAPQIAITAPSVESLDSIKQLGVPIGGVYLEGLSIADAHDELRALKPKFIHTDVQGDDLDLLGQIPSLEGLDISHPASDKTGALPPDWSRLVALDALSNLSTLDIYSNISPTSLASLQGVSSLRWLKIRAGNLTSGTVPQLPKLEALDVTSGRPVSLPDIQKMPGLAHLRLSGDILQPDAAVFKPFTRLVNVVFDRDLESESLDRLAAEGHFRNMRWLAANQDLDLEHFPSLRSLYYATAAGRSFDSSHLEKAPASVTTLQLYRATQADLDRLATLPNLRKLKRLNLYACNFEDYSVLAQLPELERIQITQAMDDASEMDLNVIPQLRSLSLRNCDRLERLVGVADHPNLVDLNVSYLKALSDLGVAAPNTTLESIWLQDCPEIPDLSAFSQAVGLKGLAINRCPLILDDSDLNPAEPLLYNYIGKGRR